MNLHVTLNLNGVISTADYPNSAGAFVINAANFRLFQITREGKVIAEFQSSCVISWDNSDPTV